MDSAQLNRQQSGADRIWRHYAAIRKAKADDHLHHDRLGLEVCEIRSVLDGNIRVPSLCYARAMNMCACVCVWAILFPI